ncbi:hypothetical protein BpHYR1_001215 [Brachionus plicatilis]|uniref:Uncharacterized protein n=1 Tax=Brachionus plicatilis TaxID=10195 RepID=A0A3M7T1M1_BRAPC|nr:hypothetical protein BpHYR1_001215 [Brachionus plicatilis]
MVNSALATLVPSTTIWKFLSESSLMSAKIHSFTFNQFSNFMKKKDIKSLVHRELFVCKPLVQADFRHNLLDNTTFGMSNYFPIEPGKVLDC